MPDRNADQVADLPDLISIMVVDVEGFSRHDDRQQDELAVGIRTVLEDACQRGGMEDLWEEREFLDGTGDGFILGFAPRFLPRVVDRYFDALQEALAARRPQLKSRGMRLRLRLSLNVGPARQLTAEGIDSPVGAAMITTHRLVDAGPLRLLLKHSDPEVTLLAVALSDRVMADVVTAGCTRRRAPSEFVECPLEIAAKGFGATAYLHVPAISGEILRKGLVGVLPGEPVQAAPEPSKRQAKPRTGSVSGRHNVVAGRDVDQSQRTRTVHGDSYEAHRDMTFRRGSK